MNSSQGTERDARLELVEQPASRPLAERNAVTAVQPITPDQMLGIVVQRGAPLEEVERYMALYERWQARQAQTDFSAAIAGFKAESIRIIKNQTIGDGPMAGKRYADLFAVVDVVTPVLSKHGLSHSWKLTQDASDWIEVTCTLSHVGGHAETVSMGGPPDKSGAKNAIQSRASTKTYLERYTLLAILGLAAQGDDDDGRGGTADTQQAGGETPVQRLIKDGMAKALGGQGELNKWWASLNARQRNEVGKEFGAMKKRAREAEEGGAQ